MSFLTSLFIALHLGWAALSRAHVVITYPGWRGNNLLRNEAFPKGMQWESPCGGLPVTTNRTQWFIDGGTIAFQPGWFTGHKQASIFINLGLGEQADDSNYTWPLTKFHITGPTDNPYPGSICLPLLELPAELRKKVKSGDLATIQIVETGIGGLYTTATRYADIHLRCADIIFTDDRAKVPTVDERNCFNSSDIEVFTQRDVALPRPTSTTATTNTVWPTTTDGAWGWGCEDNARAELYSVSKPSWCSSETSPASSSTSPSPSSATSSSSSPAEENSADGGRGHVLMTAQGFVIAAVLSTVVLL